MNSKIRLVTFDAVNTLLKVSPDAVVQYAKAAKDCGVEVCEDRLNNSYEPAWLRIKNKFPNYGVNQGLTSKEWWKRFVREVFNGAGYVSLCNNDQVRLERISERLYEQFGQQTSWKVTDGVPEMLTALKEKGFKTAIVSNFDERLPIVLQQLKLDSFFDYLVTSVAARAEKPSTLIFEYALQRAGVSAQEGLHVGDSFEEDVLPARSLGMHAVLFDEEAHSRDSLHHFKCLPQLIL